jgi:hypothetical protein
LIFPIVELGDASGELCVKLARRLKENGRNERKPGGRYMILKIVEILFIPTIIFLLTRDDKESDTYEQK